jgi:Trk-type K+ transport system membrane component
MAARAYGARCSRGAGASAATVANWSANLLITVTFLSLISAVGVTAAGSVTTWRYEKIR